MIFIVISTVVILLLIGVVIVIYHLKEKVSLYSYLITLMHMHVC
jgi:hypothetical protein